VSEFGGVEAGEAAVEAGEAADAGGGAEGAEGAGHAAAPREARPAAASPGAPGGAAPGGEAKGSKPVAWAVLEHIARAIVDDPEAVSVRAVERRRGSVEYRLRVAPPDVGRIIGRRGRVAQAMRTVVRAAGAEDGVDATVEIEG
jgi:predicted RNA-binding protein YlqC (UPF0109 family)